MAGTHGGRRDGAGRKDGSKNKATLEREQRALDELRGRATRLAPQLWAKDALEDLVPEALDLTGKIKNMVAKLQELLYPQLNDPKTAEGAATSKLMVRLRDWMVLLKDAEVATSLIMSRAAEFQSPKLTRVAVGVGFGLIGGAAGASQKAEANVTYIDDPNAASRVYQRMVQGAAA